MSEQAAAPPGELVEAHLLGLPVPLWQRLAQHSDELLREFALLQLDEDHHRVPRRLLEVVAELGDRYGSFGSGPEEQLRQAAATGQSTIDLHYRLPAAGGEAAAQLGALLDEADEFCRAGEHLLTLATPPDQVRLRRWFLEEFVRQTGGAEPVPWSEPAAG